MVFDDGIVEKLEVMPSMAWSGEVFRHMFGDNRPDRENVRGARWNPPGVAAIYTSLDKSSALAEAEYYINLQPLRPKAKRLVYQLKVSLASVLDLSTWSDLSKFGINQEAFGTPEYDETQHLGGAVAWLKHDGLLVPSARSQGTNLIIFPGQQNADYEFTILDSEVVE